MWQTLWPLYTKLIQCSCYSLSRSLCHWVLSRGDLSFGICCCTPLQEGMLYPTAVGNKMKQHNLVTLNARKERRKQKNNTRLKYFLITCLYSSTDAKRSFWMRVMYNTSVSGNASSRRLYVSWSRQRTDLNTSVSGNESSRWLYVSWSRQRSDLNNLTSLSRSDQGGTHTMAAMGQKAGQFFKSRSRRW